ncbi:MAG: RNA 2',3'-cyclic phosphodiesterase, partial [Actinobacteria bacterium]|nr:RNA 2',3'-cyclic phosphodiesterase [Actinomycetota bacterium]
MICNNDKNQHKMDKKTGGNGGKRIFIGISIPEGLRKRIYEFSLKTFGSIKNSRIIPHSNLHITLKFLGYTPTEKINGIKKAILKACENAAAFTLEITGAIGAFPDTRRARLAYIETGKGNDDICSLYNCLENVLSEINIRKEKRAFFSHITVVRFKNITDIQENASVCRMEPPAVMECIRVNLYESILRPGGA